VTDGKQNQPPEEERGMRGACKKRGPPRMDITVGDEKGGMKSSSGRGPRRILGRKNPTLDSRSNQEATAVPIREDRLLKTSQTKTNA